MRISTLCLLLCSVFAGSFIATAAQDANDESFAACVPGKVAQMKYEGQEYLLFTPQEAKPGSRASGAEGFPVIIHLHGSAGQGYSMTRLIDRDETRLILKHAQENSTFPFFIIAPAMAAGSGNWADLDTKLFGILDKLAASYPIDIDRIYLAGVSMGGFGTWNLAMKHPGKFAAIVPICGGGSPNEAWRIRHMPAWVFHGELDVSVPVSRSIDMVNAIKLCGGSPKFSLYPDMGHDIWVVATKDCDYFKWFVQFRRTPEQKEMERLQTLASMAVRATIAPQFFFIEPGAPGSRNVVFKLANNSLTNASLSFSLAENGCFQWSGAPASIDLPVGGEAKLDMNLQMKQAFAPGQIQPLDLGWKSVQHREGYKDFALAGSHRFFIASRFDCPKAERQVSIDGSLDEWGELPFKVDKPAQVLTNPASYSGPEDCRFEFGVSYDDKYIYVAVKAVDDKLCLASDKKPWQQDGVEIRLDARPEAERNRVLKEFENIFLAAISPASSASDSVVCYESQRLPEGTRFASVKTPAGHNVELAIPVSFLNKVQGHEWTDFRLNVAVDDLDIEGGESAQLWWQTDWRWDRRPPVTGCFRRR